MAPGATGEALPVYLEVAAKRVFACAVDWPGWCRSGRDVELALDALAEYAPRYAPVVELAGLSFPHRSVAELVTVERLAGNATTEFGVPGQISEGDRAPVDEDTAARLVALLSASWTYLDKVAAGTPEELRKGPRGGGRDRTKMLGHVVEAEYGYSRSLGLRPRQPDPGDPAAIAAMRAQIVEVLGSPWDGPDPLATGKRWPPRYFARRTTWHALDHAWEMQDRSTPA